MKRIFLTLVVLTFLLNSCAALLDGKVARDDGKPSPFVPQVDKYEPPTDPTMRR